MWVRASADGAGSPSAGSGCGVHHACLPEQGRLLEVLARGRSGGLVGETGTGCGVGLAWMASAAGAATRLVSVERDPRLAAAAAEVFQDTPNVAVLEADWTAIARWAPFDLLVLDAGRRWMAGWTPWTC